MKHSCVILLYLAALICIAVHSESAAPKQEAISWSELPELPNKFGLGGAFTGVSNGALIVAGGSNFPHGMELMIQNRTWYDDIYILPNNREKKWLTGYKLNEPIALGASVTSDDSLILIGGSNAEGDQSEVVQLTWNASSRITNQVSLPPLPQSLSLIGAAEIDGVVYVVGGQFERDKMSLTKKFWSLDLNKLDSGWKSLVPWEGPARRRAIVVGQNIGNGKFVYIIGGEESIQNENGEIQSRHFTDGYRYSLRYENWEPIADAPHPVTGAPGIAYGQSHILIFGGNTWKEKDVDSSKDHPSYSRDLLVYHTITDTWVVKGGLPLGVVSSEAVSWGEGIAITGGETEPGIMTPKVQIMIHDSGANASFGIMNYAFLLLYMVALIYMGFYFSRREKGTKDYFLASHRIPWWAAGLSILGTGLSALTYISYPALVYSTDWFLFPQRIGLIIAPLITIYFFLPFYRRLNVTTAYEYLEKRFNLPVRLYGSVQFIIFQLIRISIILYLPAVVLSTIAGINIYLCILFMGLISTFYTVLGGIEAVVWSDVLQVIIFLVGIIIALIVIPFHIDNGFKGIIDIGLADYKYRMLYLEWDITAPVLWVLLISSAIGSFLGPSTDQTTIQRYLTTKDEKAAAKGIWLNTIIGIPIGFLFYGMGSALYAYYKTHPVTVSMGMQNDAIFPLFIAQNLPFGLAGFVIAAIFSAAMSSLDSGMNSVATVFVTDFYRRFKPKKPDRLYLYLARSVTLVIGLIATIIALSLVTFDIHNAALFAASIAGLFISGLGGLFVLGIFTRRANSIGALVGAITSAIVLYFVKIETPIHFLLYASIGFITCFIVGYLSSLFIPERKKSLEGLTIYTILARKE